MNSRLQTTLRYTKNGMGEPCLDLRIRRNFLWRIVVADVTRAITGAGFLSHYGLMVDMKNSKFVDREGLSSTCTTYCWLPHTLRSKRIFSKIDSTRYQWQGRKLRRQPLRPPFAYSRHRTWPLNCVMRRKYANPARRGYPELWFSPPVYKRHPFKDEEE